jgi:hypothetical protein
VKVGLGSLLIARAMFGLHHTSGPRGSSTHSSESSPLTCDVDVQAVCLGVEKEFSGKVEPSLCFMFPALSIA